jgi:ApaG protein
MVTKITEGVKVTVETSYQPEYSNPANSHFMFSYKINIENLSDYTVQLISRHWYIFDSNGTHREVEGEGVIGVQPVLEPNEIHEYVSGCNLKTEMGKMSGTYTFKRLVDNQSFEVSIPEFELLCPFKLN